MAQFKAMFLDRDGVINEYLPQRYVETPEQLIVLPGVAGAIKKLNDAGVLAIVISNQQGVAKGVMSASELKIVTDSLRERLAREADARLDAVYYCMHGRDEGCLCRKPRPGMISTALRAFGLDPGETLFVGDSASDLAAAAAAGVKIGVLVLCGANRYYDPRRFDVQPDLVFSDLASVADWVLEERH